MKLISKNIFNPNYEQEAEAILRALFFMKPSQSLQKVKEINNRISIYLVSNKFGEYTLTIKAGNKPIAVYKLTK